MLAVFAGAAACLALPVNPAAAGEVSYCVTCKGPDQSYLCKVVGEGSRPNDALKLYCIIRTAKEGNHASCKAKRDIEGCVGEPKVYSYDGPTLPADIASDPRAKKIMGRLAHEQQKFDKPKGQTLVGLTGRAVKSSRKGLRNAREAITGPSDETEASSETTASTPPPSPEVSTPAPQVSAAPQVLTPVPQASVAQPEALPEAAPPPEPSPPSRMRRMKNAAASAGSAVGGFARKSYSCMWSLFRNCGGETEKSPE
jgi:hypothetical protein